MEHTVRGASYVEGDIVGRIARFRQDAYRRQAQRITESPYGFLVLDHEFAASFDHNRLILTDRVDAANAVDELFDQAGVGHRLVGVDDDKLGESMTGLFVEAGYSHAVHLIMHRIGNPDRISPAAGVDIVELSPGELVDRDRRTWRETLPEASDDVVRQLAERRATRTRAAEVVQFLGVRDATGHAIAHADLYMSPSSGVAQIEDVRTEPEHRNRGLARAIMTEAEHRAQLVGCGLIFLLAHADDWPWSLYHRLGYRTVGRSHEFLRTQA